MIKMMVLENIGLAGLGLEQMKSVLRLVLVESGAGGVWKCRSKDGCGQPPSETWTRQGQVATRAYYPLCSVLGCRVTSWNRSL